VILVIDNHDSFTWNLVHYLKELGSDVEVARSDELTAEEALASAADGFLISPGPGTPDEAGVSLDLVGACAGAGRPLLGICLGHQAIGQYFGGRVKRSHRLMHGKTCLVDHDGTGVFDGLPSPFTAARYHSLDVAAEGLPGCLAVNATAPDSSVMGMRHLTLPIHGVQFHPESIASEQGHALLSNFLRLAGPRSAGETLEDGAATTASGQIRKARIEDVPRLVQIRSHVTENLLSNPHAARSTDYLRYISADSCWVWQENGSIMGFSALDAEKGWLWALFVDPPAAGRGIGRALLDRAVVEARARRLERISLTTAPGTRAEHVYRAGGWHVSGRDPSGDLIFTLLL
jgi:anthranilate synthase component 2